MKRKHFMSICASLLAFSLLMTSCGTENGASDVGGDDSDLPTWRLNERKNYFFDSSSDAASKSGSATIVSEQNEEIPVEYGGFASARPESGWHTIEESGYFRNTNRIIGLLSITFTVSSACDGVRITWSPTSVYAAKDSQYEIRIAEAGNSYTCNFNNTFPNYFMLENKGNGPVDIESIVIDSSAQNRHPTLTVSSDNEDAGSVSGSGTYAAGKEVTISATTNDGYSFLGWYEGDTLISTQSDYTFTMPMRDLSYVARYASYYRELILTTEYVGSDEPSSYGTVSGDGSYVSGSDRKITATPEEGYAFLGWYEDDTLISEEEELWIKMPGLDAHYVAKFSKLYTVTLINDSDGGVMIGAGQHGYTQEVTIGSDYYGSLKQGYTLRDIKTWVSGHVSTENYTFKMPEEDVTYRITFDPIEPGTVIEMGSYPQREIMDMETIDELKKITEVNERGFIEYMGNEYAKLEGSGRRYLDISDLQYKGSRYNAGVTYFFLVEPITWKYYDGLMICDRIIDSCQHILRWVAITREDGSDFRKGDYDYSVSRAFLNGYDGSSYLAGDYTGKGFYDIAFTEDEKQAISTSEVVTEGRVKYTTHDKIFLLSFEDIFNPDYGFETDEGSSSGTRMKVATAYTMCKGVRYYDTNTYTSTWRIRTPYNFANSSGAISVYGSWYEAGEVTTATEVNGLVPAFRLN